MASTQPDPRHFLRDTIELVKMAMQEARAIQEAAQRTEYYARMNALLSKTYCECDECKHIFGDWTPMQWNKLIME